MELTSEEALLVRRILLKSLTKPGVVGKGRHFKTYYPNLESKAAKNRMEIGNLASKVLPHVDLGDDQLNRIVQELID